MKYISGFSQTESIRPRLGDGSILVWAHNLGVGDFVNAIPIFRRLQNHAKRMHLSTNPAYHLLVLQENLFDVLGSEFSPPPLEHYDLLVEIVAHPRKFTRSPVKTKRHLALSLMGDPRPERLVYRRLQDQLQEAGFSISDIRPSLELMDEDLTWARHALDEHGMGEASDHLRVGIHPGAGFEPKLWDAKRFAALADRLQKSYGAQIALFIGPEDENRLQKMLREMVAPPTVVVHNCDLGQKAALIGNMDLFVSCDSGLMHIAAAQNIPLVAIFGPTHPGSWGPVHEDGIPVFVRPASCPPCGYAIAKKCNHRSCLENISVETVLVHIDRAIDRAVSRHRGPLARYVWNNCDLEYRTTNDACRRFLSHPEQVSLCRAVAPATRGQLAETLLSADADIGPPALIEALCEARILVPSWYPATQHRHQTRPLTLSVSRNGKTSSPKAHLLFAVARETDASELLTLLLNLPPRYRASVLVSRRHSLMGTTLRRHAIPYQSYSDTDDFYNKCEQLRPEAVVWASYANIDRYEPGYRHIFVDHGMHSKGHFMSGLKMGRYDLNDFDMVCVPNLFKYERLQRLGYAGQLERTGYLKGDMYYRGMPYPREEILRNLGLDPGRLLAVYCPTNIRGVGTGTLEYGYKWVLQASAETGLNLLIRPHEEDYVRRPHLLEQIRKECRPGQIIVLDWESPLWICMADVFAGDASSINLEAVMAGVPAVLLPAGQAQPRQGLDHQVANLHQKMVHEALPTAASAEQLADWLRRPPPAEVDRSLLTYFNESYDGRAHERFFEAVDRLLEHEKRLDNAKNLEHTLNLRATGI